MSLFGNTTAGTNPTTNNAAGSLFGNTANNVGQTSSLFGSTTNKPAANPTPSLFGNTLTVPNPTNNQTSNNNSSSLFGSFNQSTNNPQQQAQAQAQVQTQTHGLGQSEVERAMQNQATQFQAGLGSTLSMGGLSAAQQQELARSRLQQFGIDPRTNTKTVFDQTKTLIQKWDPNSQDTLMQAYLYNAVNAAYAPFYHRNADEDEKSWEAALAEKPKAIEGAEGQQISYVPVLVRGFKALGERVEYQVNVVNQMRARLHEMNNSLAAVMAAHQQRISVKLEGAKRQHTVLSQRCLRLAVKVQVLRNRGYALDSAEESLRKSFLSLEKQVMDPGFVGREEEIWARMVVLRERSRWLEEEGKRLGQQVEERQKPSLPEEVQIKTKKILSDYENQLNHLNRELNDVKKEYADWEESQQAKGLGRS